VSARSEHQQTREAAAAYHGAALTELIAHVAGAIDRFREGEMDAFEVDHILFQYSRAAKELWKFCNMTNIEFTSSLVREQRDCCTDRCHLICGAVRRHWNDVHRAEGVIHEGPGGVDRVLRL